MLARLKAIAPAETRPTRPTTLLQPLSLPLPLSPPPAHLISPALYADMQAEACAPHRHPSYPPPGP
jgi:hypothetical protein